MWGAEGDDGHGGLTPLETHELLPHVYFAYGKDTAGRVLAGDSLSLTLPINPRSPPRAPRTLGEDVHPISLIEFLQDEVHPTLVDAVPCRDQSAPRDELSPPGSSQFLPVTPLTAAHGDAAPQAEEARVQLPGEADVCGCGGPGVGHSMRRGQWGASHAPPPHLGSPPHHRIL